MGRARRRALSLIVLLLLAGGCVRARPPGAAEPEGPKAARGGYSFAWRDISSPRGGTTQGPAVELDPAPSEAWRRLRDPAGSAFEHDRAAILAMAGTYRVSFDFLEVMGFRPGFVHDRPYQSWGTEYVYVQRDEPRRISLQHLLVMFVNRPDGTVEGPLVTRHWRQEWRYEDRDLVTYRGHETWATERRSAARAKGTWTQAVFQVDDSPRYEAAGRWEHLGNVSTWLSERTWRPLPRREWSVRHDYDVLIGTNRVTITPTGWVQEEENLKVVLDAHGTPIAGDPALAKEDGLARYERVQGFDDSAARRYRERTEPFWDDVREAWSEIVARHPRFTLRAAPDQGALFVPLFEYAERLADGAPLDRADAARFARTTVRGYLRGP
ncbi:MAG TPA: DUF6607 family protein [Candidatus Binatia bacterium]